ncbi:site-specific integrase [Pseudomonas soli]|uniref:site-specific integrase n=1 Tax=Pseudomonas soli TaxID=1306993 RepID=UPI0038100F8C
MKTASTVIKHRSPDIRTEGLLLSELRPEDIALDLTATARIPSEGRIYWEDDKLVQIGKNSVEFKLALALMTPDSRTAFRNNAIDYIDKKLASADTVFNALRKIKTVLARRPTVIFDLDWANHAIISESFRANKYQIRKILEHLQKRHPTIVTDEALNLLAQVRLDRQTSRNILSDDPEKSWLTDDEYDAALSTTWDFYDTTNYTQTTLIRLLALQYSRRPVQLRNLKFKDLKSGASKQLKNLAENEIHFPSAKEKDVQTAFREGKFEPHPIADHLWQLLQIQKNQVRQIFQETLKTQLSAEDIEKLPIFTTRSRIKKSISWLKNKLGLTPAEHLHDELFHARPGPISRVISFSQNLELEAYNSPQKKLIAPISLPLSARTHQPIVVTATRLRHTRARQLARQGVPRPILSYWLGHNDDTALDSYYNDPAEEARQLDEKLSKGLTPIAMAFQGRIIATGAEATFPDDSSKRLEFAKDYHLRYVGHCGKFSFCATTSVPIPCYRCRSFEPLVDAPHEEVLEALIYRQSQEQELIKIGGMRKLLTPIDLSADIRAVERCIHLCRMRREDTQRSQEEQREQDREEAVK